MSKSTFEHVFWAVFERVNEMQQIADQIGNYHAGFLIHMGSLLEHCQCINR
ncbi:MAG: hypothetical protein RLZZ398_1422 [Verrucomicrobiota bacterium]